MAPSIVSLLLTFALLSTLVSSKHVSFRDISKRVTPNEIELGEIIGPSSFVDPQDEPTCDLARTGQLSYYDCLQTIWQMPNDPRSNSYTGQRMFFPPQGENLECAIAIIPFPITTPNSDTTSWTWLRENAVRIGAKCQRRKTYGSGGYKYGLGKNSNTAIIVFRLSRPQGLPYNYRASLSASNEAAWTTLYNIFENIAFPANPTDPNEPSSSSGQTISSLSTLNFLAQTIQWTEPLPGTHEISTDEITPAALEYFPGGINDGSHSGHASLQSGGEGDIEQGGTCENRQDYCHIDADCGVGCKCLRLVGKVLAEMLFGLMFCCEYIGSCGDSTYGIGG